MKMGQIDGIVSVMLTPFKKSLRLTITALSV